jgi:hypothetical protein
MYGMVNNAIREYVIETFGAENWEKTARSADIETGEFGSVMPYDDAITFSIVGSACQVLKRDPGDFLRAVGVHWVNFGSRSAFSSLLRFGGHTFEDFVGNLDDMHLKIKASLPELQPPSFRVEPIHEGQIRVTYHSEREGLFPFVEGLFEGLSDYFDQPVEIVNFEQLSQGAGVWTLKVAAQRTENKVA